MDNYIKFTEKDHSYKDPKGIPYTSVTRFLGSFSKPFDDKMIAVMVSKKRARVSMEEAEAQGVTQEDILSGYEEFSRGITVEEVLKEWDAKRDKANNHGNRIHNVLELYDIEREIHDEELRPLVERMQKYFTQYKKIVPEAILYSKDHFISGMADKVCFRTKTRADYYDYKTNVIKYDSSSIDQYTGEMKWNNKFMLGPLSHLEDCNFNKYAMQLSIYAWLGETTFGIKPGKLAIINIDKEFNETIIPVPYLKYEVEAIMASNDKNILVKTALQDASTDGSF